MDLKSCFANDIINKEQLARECVEIANSAKFNTDYNDVYEHLFFGNNMMLVFAFEDNKMRAFSSLFLTQEEDGTPHIHLNGVVVSPDFQKNGIAKLMLSRAAGYIYGLNSKEANQHYRISASVRTQNPAIYKLLQKNSTNMSPKVDRFVDKQHSYIIHKMDKELHPFLGNYNERFIVKNAYSSPKIKAGISDESVKKLFQYLGEYDAYILFAEEIKDLDLEQVKNGIEDYKNAIATKDQYLRNLQVSSTDTGFIINKPCRNIKKLKPIHPLSPYNKEKIIEEEQNQK